MSAKRVTDVPGASVIRMILDELGVIYMEKWSAPKPHGRIKYDFAVFQEHKMIPAFVIDIERIRIDYHEEFGERRCRKHIHNLAKLRGDVKRAAVAAECGVVRLTFTQNDLRADVDEIKDVLATYVDMLVDDNANVTSEVACAYILLNRYRYESYVAPQKAKLNKQEEKFFEGLDALGIPYVRCDVESCKRGEACPYDL